MEDRPATEVPKITMKQPSHFSRRNVLKTAGAGAGAAALGTGLQTSGTLAQDRPYEGVTLRGLGLAGTAWNAAVEQFATEFEEETGAKVEWDFQPWEQTMPKLQADLAAGAAQYDFFCNDIEFQYTIYPSLMPINELIEESGYNMEGFFDPIYTYGEGVAGGQEGVRYGLPMRVGASWVFYRTDLISEFPTTWADYNALLAEQTNDDTFGLAFAGVPAQLVKLFLARYWSMGDPPDVPRLGAADQWRKRRCRVADALRPDAGLRTAGHPRLGQSGRLECVPERRRCGPRRLGEFHSAQS